MFKIKNTISFAIIISCLLVFGGSSVKAQLPDKPLSKEQRMYQINKAYRQVYGRESTVDEQAFWLSVWSGQVYAYNDIVSVETKKLNSEDKNMQYERVQVIGRAISDSFGRAATPIEIKKWAARKEVYAEIIKIQKAYLYSPDGSKELSETIHRYLLRANKKEPTEKEKKDFLNLVIDRKFNYTEMGVLKNTAK